MAIIDVVRYKPDMYRSSLESLVSELDTDVTPATGTVHLNVQAISFDDTVVTVQNYVPGAPETERNITVTLEDVISLSLASFDGQTPAQITGRLMTELDSWGSTMKIAIPNLRKVMRAARRAAPRPLL
jgi:hypothetical protein